MARMSRVELFASDETAIVHVMNRAARRCWLPSDDPVTGRNDDHRKVWIDEQLAHQARYFGIDSGFGGCSRDKTPLGSVLHVGGLTQGRPNSAAGEVRPTLGCVTQPRCGRILVRASLATQRSHAHQDFCKRRCHSFMPL